MFCRRAGDQLPAMAPPGEHHLRLAHLATHPKCEDFGDECLNMFGFCRPRFVMAVFISLTSELQVVFCCDVVVPAVEIPGYVYDKATNRYFKVPKAGRTTAPALAATAAASSNVRAESLNRLFQRNSTESSSEGSEAASTWDPGRSLMAILQARELHGPVSRQAAVPRQKEASSRGLRSDAALADAAAGGSMVKELLAGSRGYARSWISHSQPLRIEGSETGAACPTSLWAGNIGTRQ